MKMEAKRTSGTCGKLLFLLLITNSSLLITNAQWVQVSNGMGNQYVLSLAYSGINIFAGTYAGGGVYLSTDNGTSWTQTSLNNQNVFSLAVNGNYIFAGTGIPANGIYLSTNNGTSWAQSPLNGLSVLSLAVNGNYIFAGVGNNDGVYLSTNNGGTWTQTSLNNRDVPSIAVNGNNVFAGTGTYGVYLSTNNGTNWTQTSLNNQDIPSLAVNGNNIFAGTEGYGVYLSTNNGTSWTQVGLNGQIVRALEVNGNNVFAGTYANGVYISHDNGVSWVQRNEGLGIGRIHVLCILNNYIFAGTGGSSVYRRPLGELTGIQAISNETPEQFSLSQNYPNPFNPRTKIRFSLPNSSFAKLVVYDMLGRELETLVSEQLSAGTYEADWSADKFSSGVYYYKLYAGEYNETKKMILIK